MKPIPGHLRPVFEAPLQVAGGVNVLGRALWLYQAIVVHASDQGVVIRSRHRFAEALGVSEAEIGTWLNRLLVAKLIELRSPSTDFLVIALCMWPRSGVVAGDLKNAQAASSPAAALAADVTEKENKQNNVRSRDGGLREGSALLAELRAMLGEADAAELGPVIAGYPPAVVRQALDRVKATPSRQIKKSRMALLRFLLKNASHTTHDHPPTPHSQP